MNDRAQTGCPGITKWMIIVIVVAFGVLLIASAADPPTKSELQAAEDRVADAYGDTPWWAVGMMPVFLIMIGIGAVVASVKVALTGYRKLRDYA